MKSRILFGVHNIEFNPCFVSVNGRVLCTVILKHSPEFANQSHGREVEYKNCNSNYAFYRVEDYAFKSEKRAR